MWGEVLNCAECENRAAGYVGLFNITCAACRTALAQHEPCKVLRKQMVEDMEKWGDTPDWQLGAACGCKKACKRLQVKRELSK